MRKKSRHGNFAAEMRTRIIYSAPYPKTGVFPDSDEIIRLPSRRCEDL